MTGVQTCALPISISKDAKYVENRSDWDTNKKVGDFSDKAIEVYLKDGKAVAGAIERNRYYADISDENIKSFNKTSFAVTGYPVKFKGSMVKDCLVTKDSHTYYMDKYGDKMVSYPLQIGYIKVTNTNGVLSYEFSVQKTDAANEYKAYLVFDGKGIAYDNIAAGRQVSAGSKRYYSTGIDYKTVGGVDNAMVFYYNR